MNKPQILQFFQKTKSTIIFQFYHYSHTLNIKQRYKTVYHKNIAFISSLIIALLSAHFAFAQTDDINDFEFVVLNKNSDWDIEVYVKEYRGADTVIRIPSQFEGNNVNGIREQVFAGKGLTGVFFPDSLYNISSEAFVNNALTELVVPENISYIGYRAFADNQLSSVVILSRVLVSSYAFQGNNITHIAAGSNIFFYNEEWPSFELGFDAFYIANNRRAGTYTYNDGRWSVEYNINEDDFKFEIEFRGDGPIEALVAEYRGASTSIQIPAFFGSYFIVIIGEKAFAEKGLVSAVLPKGVYIIEEEAFADNELAVVNIPDGVLWISYKAFAGNQLVSINIPDNIYIRSLAFAGNYITRITVGSGVNLESEEGPVFELGFDDFYEKNKGRAGTYVYQDGRWSVEYDITENDFAANICEDGQSLRILDYFGADTVISIPSRMGGLPVSEIGYWAFFRKGLTGIAIPDSITAIHRGAFAENSIVTVTIPGSVNTIEEEAFVNNELAAVIIEDGAAVIGYRAFAENKIESLIIPDSVADIDGQAFAGNRLAGVIIPRGIRNLATEVFLNNKLASLTIPDNIDSIGYSAFAGNQLADITIPETVTSIGNEAFRNNRITSAFIPNSVARMGTNVFDNTVIVEYELDNENDFEIELNQFGTAVITGYKGRKRVVRIPPVINNIPVTEIGIEAFMRKNLTGVFIPDSVIAVRARAFARNQLVDVTIPHSIAVIDAGAFSNNQINQIAIGALVVVYNYSFNNSFNDFYNRNDNKAGTYRFIDGQWEYSGTEEENETAIVFAQNRSLNLIANAADPWNKLGNYYFSSSRYEEAIEAFSQAIQYSPRTGFLWYNRGLSYKNIGILDAAMADYSEAIRLNGRYVNAWIRRGDIYLEIKQYENAISDYTEAVRLDPSVVAAWNNRGVAHSRNGGMEAALADWEQALEINPENELVKRNIENLLNRKNDD